MLKKEVEKELQDLKDAVKAKYYLTDLGIDRLIAGHRTKFLGLYSVKTHYKCDYEFKGQKCTRRFMKTRKVVAMGAHDALNDVAGVYYVRACDHGACCPECNHWVKNPVQISCLGDKREMPKREE